MTAKLVTLEEVKAGLRIDSTDDDDQLDLLIGAASNAVINYLKGQASILTSPDSPPETSAEIKQATILMVKYFYDGSDDAAFEMGYLPKPVTALLYPLRDPALG